jgi:hypothetical protein
MCTEWGGGDPDAGHLSQAVAPTGTHTSHLYQVVAPLAANVLVSHLYWVDTFILDGDETRYKCRPSLLHRLLFFWLAHHTHGLQCDLISLTHQPTTHITFSFTLI